MVIMGAEAQAVAVAWQVYEITHRAIDLGYTGLVLFLPGLLFLLPAGHVADRYDRREVILVCYVLQILCTLALLIFALRGTAQGRAYLCGAVPDRIRHARSAARQVRPCCPTWFPQNTL